MMVARPYAATKAKGTKTNMISPRTFEEEYKYK